MADPKDPNKKYDKPQLWNVKKPEQMPESMFGKVPPQAPMLEEAVLGAIMLDKDALTVVLDILRPESFYKDAHQRIYKIMMELFEKSQPIDLLTVTEALRKAGDLEKIGGGFYLVELTNRVASAANLEYHARIIAQKHIQRELIRVSTKVIKDAFEDTTDVFEMLDDAEQGLFSITQQNLSRGYESMGTLATKALKQLEELSKKEDGLTGIPTGFTDLDRLTSGWQPSDLVILAARPGMGKCLGKGTKVLMYDGSLKKVEDVVKGDLLMGDDSTPRRVLSIARGREKMYWVRQNKGIDYRVNESHILSLKRSRNEGGHQKGEVLNISVRDYLQKSAKFQSNYKGYKVAVEFAEQKVPLPAYFLGIWLGDGTAQKSEITTNDEEVVAYLENYADELGLKLKVYKENPKKCPQYKISGGYTGNKGYSLQAELRKLDVLGNKHIPQNYLTNSTEQRLELLAGLLDSDGHYLEQSNGYEITQKDKALTEQIKFLCDSLGFRTSLAAKKASIKSIGYETEVYRVRIYGDIDRIPVRIQRKQARPWKSSVDWQVTGITLEEDIVDDYYGFEIDGNRLFLLEDMTVTHNTAFVLSLARNAAMDFEKPIAIFSLEMSNVQLVQRLISMEAEIPGSKLRNGKLEDYEWQQLHSAIERMSEVPIYIDDTPGINIFELRAKCRRLKKQHDIQLVVIDYLQLMSGGGDNQRGNREQEVSAISRALKGLAKELNVPILALSQLSRAVEMRGGTKRPQLSDLRECITGDTLIYNAKTGAYQAVVDLLNQKEECYVLAMDDEYKLQAARCLDIWETGEKEVYEVTTQSGFKIRASLNHPFFTINGWRQLIDLKEGDYVATPRVIEHQHTKSDLKDEEIVLLAHMIGDGCYVKRQPVHYTSEDEASLDVVENCAKLLWKIEARRVKDSSSKRCYHLYLPAPYPLTHGVKHPFTNLLERVGLNQVRSFNKTIPQAIFKSTQEQIALFIKHLWATDGGIFIRKGKGSAKIYYSSTSIDLIQGLKSLLLRFEINSTINKSQKENYRPGYTLNITGKNNIMAFAEKIGIFGSKATTLRELVKICKNKDTVPNSDVISKKLWNEIRELKKKKGFTERGFQSALGSQYCGSSLYRSNISRERLTKIATVLDSKVLNALADSDIKWEKIVSIKHIGTEMTYDLHIETHHNFVANNFIIHNSGAIEQDADIVSFIYRPEYYQIMEDEEGNSLKGVAEIIFAKHRHGALETIKLKFTGEFAKFSDMEAFDFDSLDDPASLNDPNSPYGGNVITRPSKMNNDEDIPF